MLCCNLAYCAQRNNKINLCGVEQNLCRIFERNLLCIKCFKTIYFAMALQVFFALLDTNMYFTIAIYAIQQNESCYIIA